MTRRFLYGLEWGWKDGRWYLVSPRGRLQRVVWLTVQDRVEFQADRAFYQALARSRDPIGFVCATQRPTVTWERTRAWVNRMQRGRPPRRRGSGRKRYRALP